MAKPLTPKPYSDAEVDDAISITPEVIQEEYPRVAPHLRHFRKMLTQAKIAERKADLRVEVLEAQMRKSLRAASAAAKRGDASYMSNEDIDAAIECDPKRVEAVEASIDAAGVRDDIEGICEAIRTKREMLISLGADRREGGRNSRS